MMAPPGGGEGAPPALSDTGAAFLGGLLAHLPALLPFTSPSCGADWVRARAARPRARATLLGGAPRAGRGAASAARARERVFARTRTRTRAAAGLVRAAAARLLGGRLCLLGVGQPGGAAARDAPGRGGLHQH